MTTVAPRPRVDARAKVTGAVRYGTDRIPEGMAYAAMAVATIGKGRIVEIDTEAAACRIVGITPDSPADHRRQIDRFERFKEDGAGGLFQISHKQPGALALDERLLKAFFKAVFQPLNSRSPRC